MSEETIQWNEPEQIVWDNQPTPTSSKSKGWFESLKSSPYVKAIPPTLYDLGMSFVPFGKQFGTEQGREELSKASIFPESKLKTLDVITKTLAPIYGNEAVKYAIDTLTQKYGDKEGLSKLEILAPEARKVLEYVSAPYAAKGITSSISEGLPFLNKPVSEVTTDMAGKVGKIFGRIPGSFKTKAENIFESVKSPYEVQPGATTGLRKGAESNIGELQNIETQLYDKAQKMTPQPQKVNFETLTEKLNDFEQTDLFGRLKPPEKVQIRSAIKQIRKEISPTVRTGKTQVTPEEFQDIMDTGTGQFVEGTGEVKLPGTFTSARATRSWLSEESARAFEKGDKNLGTAYRDLKNGIEGDLEKSVGGNTWSAWKEADSFKTRKHMMDDIFGRTSEKSPGVYDFRKIKKEISDIPKQRLESAGFSNEEIKGLNEIGDATTFRIMVENHPSLKVIIPWAVLEAVGIPVPSISPLRRAASHTHLLPGGGVGGY